jgi:hypothetical protein
VPVAPTQDRPAPGGRATAPAAVAVTPGRAAGAALAGVGLAALALRVGGAIAWPNVAWPDEIFQTLEQAHRLVFGAGVVPWEFRVGARSWLLPGALAGAMAIAPASGHGFVRAAEVALALGSLVPVGVAFAWSRARGAAAALAAAVACAAWWELVLLAPKAFAEVVAAHLLVLGLFLASDGSRRARVAWAGAALALAVALRVHLAPAVLVAALVLPGRPRERLAALALGAAPVVLVAGALDWATWGTPFHSYWTTVRVNVLEGRSRMYGVDPWYAYAGWLAGAWSWALAPALALAAVGARRRPAAAAAALAVLVVHSAIAHKEYRFVYPAVVLLVVLAAEGTAEAIAWAAGRTRAPAAALALAAALAWAGASLAVGAGRPEWSRGRSGVEATALAGAGPICGLALVGQHWAASGGYTWLHRDVPIYLPDDGEALAAAWPGFDVALVSPEYAGLLRGFRVERCWPEVCLARRAGGCAPTPAPTINARLAERGE